MNRAAILTRKHPIGPPLPLLWERGGRPEPSAREEDGAVSQAGRGEAFAGRDPLPQSCSHRPNATDQMPWPAPHLWERALPAKRTARYGRQIAVRPSRAETRSHRPNATDQMPWPAPQNKQGVR